MFNGYIFLTVKKLLLCFFPNFSWSAFSGEGGQDLSISYPKQNCFSHGEGSFKESIHISLYIHNYHSFHFTTILLKILYLILFGHIKIDFGGILFGSASRVNWDKLTVSEMVQDIESVGQRDWFICHIF